MERKRESYEQLEENRVAAVQCGIGLLISAAVCGVYLALDVMGVL